MLGRVLHLIKELLPPPGGAVPKGLSGVSNGFDWGLGFFKKSCRCTPPLRPFGAPPPGGGRTLYYCGDKYERNKSSKLWSRSYTA